MRKRSKLSQSPGYQHDYNPDDRVSRMPDEILVSILSTLPLKDAAATSQLSRRWRYMWCRTVKLDLEDYKKMLEIAAQPRLLLSERNRFINRVNRVMYHHKSPKIENFRICFDLDKHAKGAITKWIQFALSKNVETLELDLMVSGDANDDPVRNFIFPNKILDQKSGSSSKRRLLNAPSMLSKVMGIKFLKVLVLKCVNVNDEAIRKILKICPVLEHLSIYNSGHLVNVNVSGPALALTKLEIKDCCRLESIEIYDSNLVWFRYWGSVINLKLNNNPSLKTISIGEGISGIENNMFQQISCCIPYLHALELDIYRPKVNMDLISFPELPKVKKLSMIVGAWEDDSLLGLIRLARACPSLQKCTIKLIWRRPVRIQRQIRNWVTHTPHQHLEVVEIRGFYARLSDIELALYFFRNSISLKKIVIDPTYQQVEKQSPVDKHTLLEENKSRHYAHFALDPIVPGNKLVIL